MALSESMMLRKLGRILDHCYRVERALIAWDGASKTRPDVSQSLLEIFVDVEELMEAVRPRPTPEDWMGVPAEAQLGRPQAIHATHVDHPEWDFDSWLGEKLASLRHSTRSMSHFYCFEVDVEQFDWQGHTVEEFRRDAVMGPLSSVQHYAKVVYDQIYENNLKIDPRPTDDYN